MTSRPGALVALLVFRRLLPLVLSPTYTTPFALELCAISRT